MTNEEKKAILYMQRQVKIRRLDLSKWQNGVKVLLNLIEKQSKEIEELKDKNKTLKNLQNDTNRLYTEMIERKNYFERELQKSEDKIKAKIEEWDMKDFTICYGGRSQGRTFQQAVRTEVKNILQSFLEEE